MGLEVGGDAFDEVVDGDLVVLDHADDLQLRDAWKSDLQRIFQFFRVSFTSDKTIRESYSVSAKKLKIMDISSEIKHAIIADDDYCSFLF